MLAVSIVSQLENYPLHMGSSLRQGAEQDGVPPPWGMALAAPAMHSGLCGLRGSLMDNRRGEDQAVQLSISLCDRKELDGFSCPFS